MRRGDRDRGVRERERQKRERWRGEGAKEMEGRETSRLDEIM